MALLYQHKEATLGDIEGIGYAFRDSTITGDCYRGVFISSDEAAEKDLQEIVDADEVTFSGTLYRKTRSGSVSSQRSEMTVDVTDVATVALGERAIFNVVVEEA